MVFIHIFAPLFMLLLMWVHIQRHARARVNPPRPLAIGTLSHCCAFSARASYQPGPGNLDIVPTDLGLDWFYLAAYPLLDIIPGGQLWLIVFGGLTFLALMPWLPPAKAAPVAVVSLDNCNGCARCFDDCPFGAISMLPRSDGKAYDTEAVVNADNCLSCGLCVGSCPTATPFRRASEIVPGIELPEHSIAEAARRFAGCVAGLCEGPSSPRLCLRALRCHDAGVTSSAKVITMPCVAMLPPSFIDFALSRNLADGVAIAGCADGDCFYRLGDDWTHQRIEGKRDPYLRRRVDRHRLRFWQFRNTSTGGRRKALADFSADLHELPKNHKAGRARNV